MFVVEKFGELGDKYLALLDPFVAVRRLRDWTGDAPGVILRVKIAHERAIADAYFPVLNEPAAKGDGGPMMPLRAWGIMSWPARFQKNGGWRGALESATTSA